MTSFKIQMMNCSKGEVEGSKQAPKDQLQNHLARMKLDSMQL